MAQSIIEDIQEVRALLKERESASGTLAAALKKVRRRLPRRIFKQGMQLADALPLLEHPKLQFTVDEPRLRGAAREVKAHLEAIDLADRRKGRMLDILASIAFALIVVFALVVVVLRWRGII